MEKFHCSICKKHHDFYFSISLLPPDILFKMSEKERMERVYTISEEKIYLIDNVLLLSKADLFIKILGTDEFIHWETWVQLNPKEFVEMTQDLGMKDISTMDGSLYIQIPQYENSLNMNVKLNFLLTGSEKKPEIEILDEKTKLGKDYAKGISKDKFIKWMEQIYHSSSKPYAVTDKDAATNSSGKEE